MTQKNSTQVKSESQPKFVRYRFYAYTFDVPSDQALIEIKYSGGRYAVETNHAIFLLRPCHKCKQLLVSSSFYKSQGPCKKCHMILVKDWQKRNPEKVKIIKRKNSRTYRYKRKLIEAGLEP